VTLAFLGSVAEGRVPDLQRIACLIAQAYPAETEPLSLRFERLVHWKRPQILCALAGAEDSGAGGAAGTAPSAAAGAGKLAAMLKEKTSAAGFAPDLKPFHAHVTLARKTVHAPARDELSAVQWDFDAFALIESRTESAGPVYSVIESYLLGKSEKAHE
jgi:2'-5' RNA ligase